MKKASISGLIILSVLTASSSFAATTIVTETESWQPVPITVDTTKKTYTVSGTLPTSGQYYYTYQGYRCVQQKRDLVGVNVLVFSASVSGGTDIYCYPE